MKSVVKGSTQMIEQRVEQSYGNFKKKVSLIEKRHYLMDIFIRNRIFLADSICNYSEFYVEPQNAAYLSIDRLDEIKNTLKKAVDDRKIDLIVVTDAEAILSVGNCGMNRVEISVGKLMVYTAAAGIDPSKTLSVVLDVGTNRQSLLDETLYLGNRHKRVYGEQHYDFVDEFVRIAEEFFLNLYLYFYNFGRSNAAKFVASWSIERKRSETFGAGLYVLLGRYGRLWNCGQGI